MDPLSIATGGMSLIGGIQGILGGNAAKKRAMEARQRALRDLMGAMSQEEADFQANNQRVLASLTGDLGSNVESLGRSLGSGMAGAGVYNSSATAGALSNYAGEGARALAKTGADLGYGLASLRSQNRKQLANVQADFAQNDYNQAREDIAGSVSGLGGLLGAFTQRNLTNKGVLDGSNTGRAGNGTMNGFVPNVFNGGKQGVLRQRYGNLLPKGA